MLHCCSHTAEFRLQMSTGDIFDSLRLPLHINRASFAHALGLISGQIIAICRHVVAHVEQDCSPWTVESGIHVFMPDHQRGCRPEHVSIASIATPHLRLRQSVALYAGWTAMVSSLLRH